jgi:hypothetical protein
MRGKSNVIKRNVENVWGARYTLSARYLSINTVYIYYIYIHTYLTVQTACELLLLPNNTAVNRFYTNRSDAQC